MLKSKIHRATVTHCELSKYRPRAVHVNAHNEILATDDEVATLLSEATLGPVATPVA
jgi:aspartate 1-decarboxylase